jgi:tetratricopeptide (TPR) repeat protein
LRRHNAVSTDHAEVWELLGRTIVIPAQQELKKNAASVEWIPDTIRERLEEAESCFSRAEALMASAETRRELVSILNNRGMVRSLLGRYEDARRDFEDALDIEPSLELVEANLGRVLLIEDKFADAARILEGIQDAATRADTAPVLATVYIEMNSAAFCPRTLLRELI